MTTAATDGAHLSAQLTHASSVVALLVELAMDTAVSVEDSLTWMHVQEACGLMRKASGDWAYDQVHHRL